ncbi:uncharacterized protein LOC123973999 [Micropterus dolomieu]|uniref:uncharacterized protein LOC123973999 n=1 Tax=Micropterus dolomieu TaxID=147949 RepID=UPI001E8D7076|nr:uncharacterized protein LOC123973999 [Micropterus dolomieu]
MWESYRMAARSLAKSSSSLRWWLPTAVKVFPMVTGQTFGADRAILDELKKSRFLMLETTTDLQECDFVILFCPIRSRVGSDVAAAMRDVPGGKRVVLVLINHTRDVDYSPDVKRWSEDFQNVVLEVQVLFHETLQRLLSCSRNDEALWQIHEELKKQKPGYQKELLGILKELRKELPEEHFNHAECLVKDCINKKPTDPKDLLQIFKYIKAPRKKFDQAKNISSSSSSWWFPVTVKVFPITTGKTFGADQAILDQLKTGTNLTMETTDLMGCDVIIVFCPITSRVGSDVEAAMRDVPGFNLPVVLVLMHHTVLDDYSPVDRRWSEHYQNVVLDVHVLFHVTVKGLLMCSRNHEAVRQIQEELKKHSRAGSWSWWSIKDKDTLQDVKDYKPQNNINHLRILLYGPVGAGRSSFISSVSSVLRGRMCIGAEGSATNSERIFTRRYETHEIRTGKPKTYYPFVFSDVMGLEEGTGCGVHPEDIILAMKGHVKEGYRFNPVSPLSERDPGYNPDPSADDRVHLLVCVLSANSVEITGSFLEKIKAVREAASDLGKT